MNHEGLLQVENSCRYGTTPVGAEPGLSDGNALALYNVQTAYLQVQRSTAPLLSALRKLLERHLKALALRLPDMIQAAKRVVGVDTFYEAILAGR